MNKVESLFRGRVPRKSTLRAALGPVLFSKKMLRIFFDAQQKNGSTIRYFHFLSKTVSRVLYWTVIYLGGLLPGRSSHLLETGRAGRRAHRSAQSLSTVLLRIEFTASDSFQPMGELLPRLSTLTETAYAKRRRAIYSAVYFCCTFPEVAFGGRYPLSLPYEARTFLMTGLSPPPRDRLSYSTHILQDKARLVNERNGQNWINLLFFPPRSGII